MKNEFTFEKDVQEIDTIDIDPKGWYPLTIEYGTAPLGASQAYQMCWRVKGTDHMFKIPLTYFYEQSNGDYEKHFSEVLETFRVDYLDWYKQGFKEPWMQNYRRQFKEFIFTFD